MTRSEWRVLVETTLIAHGVYLEALPSGAVRIIKGGNMIVVADLTALSNEELERLTR
jgi:hypothetical protein